MTEAQKRYYEENKEKRREQMREYYRQKAQDKEQQTEEERKEARKQMREKYYRSVEVKKNVFLCDTLNSSNTKESVKAFLRECILPVRNTVSFTFLCALGKLDILKDDAILDGHDSDRSSEEGSEEGAEEEGESGICDKAWLLHHQF